MLRRRRLTLKKWEFNALFAEQMVSQTMLCHIETPLLTINARTLEHTECFSLLAMQQLCEGLQRIRQIKIANPVQRTMLFDVCIFIASEPCLTATNVS